MRYIKFRILSSGYSAESGKREWQYYTLPYEHPDHEFGLVEEDTLGQYTGLKDKNGVEIYEGDIVKANNIHTVLWHDSTAGFYLKNTKGAGALIEESNLMEVIGNIYENPELLGGKDGEN